MKDDGLSFYLFLYRALLIWTYTQTFLHQQTKESLTENWLFFQGLETWDYWIDQL